MFSNTRACPSPDRTGPAIRGLIEGGTCMRRKNKLAPISEQEREALIARLVQELPILRTKLGASQEELANLIGITRQTYSTFETARRPMSWSIYLALLMVFDNDSRTHKYIRSAGLFPDRLFGTSGVERKAPSLSSFVQMEGDDIRSYLDEQAIHAIETVIMMEFARCEKMTGDAVIRAFDGEHITLVSQRERRARRALAAIQSGEEKP